MNTSKKPNVAIFASGNGTNFEALVAARLPINIACLVCDKAHALVIDRAKQWGIPVILVQPKSFASKSELEEALLARLAPYQIDVILLAGYMRIIGNTLLAAYPQRIINLHPALLPQFPGRHGIEDAFAAGVRETGVTIHFIDEGVDTGPIIAQEAVVITAEDTIDTLAARIHEVEHRLYPTTISRLIKEGVL